MRERVVVVRDGQPVSDPTTHVIKGPYLRSIRTAGTPRCPKCMKPIRICFLTEGYFARCPWCREWVYYELHPDNLYPYLTSLDGPVYDTVTEPARNKRRKRR